MGLSVQRGTIRHPRSSSRPHGPGSGGGRPGATVCVGICHKNVFGALGPVPLRAVSPVRSPHPPRYQPGWGGCFHPTPPGEIGLYRGPGRTKVSSGPRWRPATGRTFVIHRGGGGRVSCSICLIFVLVVPPTPTPLPKKREPDPAAGAVLAWGPVRCRRAARGVSI